MVRKLGSKQALPRSRARSDGTSNDSSLENPCQPSRNSDLRPTSRITAARHGTWMSVARFLTILHFDLTLLGDVGSPI